LENLLASADQASSVSIDGVGWFLFGGWENHLETAQKLENINSTWENGPAVFAKGIHGQCVVQVTVLVF